MPNFDIVYECFCEGVADDEKHLGLIADELVDMWKHDREAA